AVVVWREAQRERVVELGVRDHEQLLGVGDFVAQLAGDEGERIALRTNAAQAGHAILNLKEGDDKRRSPRHTAVESLEELLVRVGQRCGQRLAQPVELKEVWRDSRLSDDPGFEHQDEPASLPPS